MLLITDLCTLVSAGGPAVLTVISHAMHSEFKRVQLEPFGVTSQVEITELDFAANARDFGLK